MTESTYEHQYKRTVVDFFDGRTSYDNEITLKRALPLLEMGGLKSGQQVLDIATGTGIIAIAAAQSVGPTGSVVGVDFSPGMLRQAKEKSTALTLQNVEWVQADADYVAFEGERFDTVFCSSALIYLRDISNVLRSWHQWLKPGGVAIFSGWSEQTFPAPWIIEAGDRANLSLQNINAPTGTPAKCRQLMETAGFRDIQIQAQQLGSYRSVDSLSSWDGSWFHPYTNPLAGLAAERLALITAEYRKIVAEQETKDGVWCESLAYFVSGRKS